MQKSAIAIALALGCTAALADRPADMPERKAGLWEERMTLVDMGGMSMTMETCIDETVESFMSDEHAEACTDQDFQRDGDELHFSATCQENGSTAEIAGVFTGDFETQYDGEIRTRYSPPLEGMEEMNATIEARWIADECRSGQEPGDSTLTEMPDFGDMQDMMGR